MSSILILQAHPNPTSFVAALAQHYQQGAQSAGATVTCIDVSTLQFDLVLRGGFTSPMPDEPDLARVRKAIADAEHVVWMFPTWWVGLPAALKGLIDRLFLPGQAFVYEGGPLPRGLMAGRSARYITTMDSPRLWYWLAHRRAIAASFGRGTLRFVGFSPVRGTLLFNVRKMTARRRAAWLHKLEQLGQRDAVKLLRPKALRVAAPKPHNAGNVAGNVIRD